MTSKVIYKVLSRDLWSAAESAGQFEGAAIDLTDGYIHFSTAEQLVETVQKHFAGQDDLVVVAVDVERIGTPLKWEPSRGGDLFPHLYAALPTSAVIAKYDLPLGPDQQHVFPSLAS